MDSDFDFDVAAPSPLVGPADFNTSLYDSNPLRLSDAALGAPGKLSRGTSPVMADPVSVSRKSSGSWASITPDDDDFCSGQDARAILAKADEDYLDDHRFSLKSADLDTPGTAHSEWRATEAPAGLLTPFFAERSAPLLFDTHGMLGIAFKDSTNVGGKDARQRLGQKPAAHATAEPPRPAQHPVTIKCNKKAVCFGNVAPGRTARAEIRLVLLPVAPVCDALRLGPAELKSLTYQVKLRFYVDDTPESVFQSREATSLPAVAAAGTATPVDSSAACPGSATGDAAVQPSAAPQFRVHGAACFHVKVGEAVPVLIDFVPREQRPTTETSTVLHVYACPVTFVGAVTQHKLKYRLPLLAYCSQSVPAGPGATRPTPTAGADAHAADCSAGGV